MDGELGNNAMVCRFFETGRVSGRVNSEMVVLTTCRGLKKPELYRKSNDKLKIHRKEIAY
jgi:hypothetical protein